MALPSNGVSAFPFVGLPVDGGLTAPAHADAIDRQTFTHRWRVEAWSRVSLLLLASIPAASQMDHLTQKRANEEEESMPTGKWATEKGRTHEPSGLLTNSRGAPTSVSPLCTARTRA